MHATGSAKSQSMVSIKAEKIERRKTYRRVMAEEKMLGNYVRLVDYMFVENLALRCITSTEELLGMLEICRSGQEKNPKGAFVTILSYGKTKMQFTPDEADVLSVSKSYYYTTLFFLLELSKLFIS